MNDLITVALAVDAAARPFYGDRGGEGARRTELREACAELRRTVCERALYDRLQGSAPTPSMTPQQAFERLLSDAYHAGIPWPDIVATVNRLGESGERR